MTKTTGWLARAACVALLAWAACRPAWADGCPDVDYADQEGTVRELRKLYAEERFAQLDATLACLLGDTRSFSTGKPAAAAVYQMYRTAMGGSTASAADLVRVERWAQQRPVSMFAEFAALRLRYAYAWRMRGGAYASKVPQERWQSFHQGLADTEDALYRATQELRDTPMWHQLLLAVAGDTQTRRADMRTVFEEAVRRWPNHYDLHEVALTRLVPRWGGSWDHVDGAIRHWAGQREGAEADALYARLYASVLLAFDDDPRQTRLDWPRMKRGLDALVARYPDPSHKVVAASFACAYRDAEYLKASYRRMGGEQRPSAWLRGTTLQACAPR